MHKLYKQLYTFRYQVHVLDFVWHNRLYTPNIGRSLIISSQKCHMKGTSFDTIFKATQTQEQWRMWNWWLSARTWSLFEKRLNSERQKYASEPRAHNGWLHLLRVAKWQFYEQSSDQSVAYSGPCTKQQVLGAIHNFSPHHAGEKQQKPQRGIGVILILC